MHLNPYCLSLVCFFTVIILTEVWLNQDIDVNFGLAGYTAFNLYRDLHGGGIKVFIRSHLKSKLIHNITMINAYFECISIGITYEDFNFTLISIYRPPSVNIKYFNDSFYENVLSKINLDNCILSGDFNINLFNPLNNVYVNEFIDIMVSNSYRPLITCPTKFNINNIITKYALIDHIWINFDFFTVRSIVFYELISDHFPICSIFQKTIPHNIKKIQFRDFSGGNVDNFKVKLQDFEFDFDENENDINWQFSRLYDKVFGLYNESFPIKTKTIKVDKLKPAWLCSDLQYCIDKKYLLLRQLKSGTITKESYNLYRNMLNFAIDLAKELYHLRSVIKNQGNMKNTWKFINSLVKQNPHKDNTINIVNNDNVNVSSDQTCSMFNDYFINIFPNLINDVDPAVDQFIISCNSTMFIRPVTPDEICRIINSLPNKNTHLNDIPSFILKYFSFNFIILFSLMFNRFIQS